MGSWETLSALPHPRPHWTTPLPARCQDGPRNRTTGAWVSALSKPACRHKVGQPITRSRGSGTGAADAGGSDIDFAGGRRSRRRRGARSPIRIRYGRTTLPQLNIARPEPSNALLHTRKTRFVIRPAPHESRVTLKQIGSACLSTPIGGNDPTEASVLAGLRIRLGPVGSAREPTGPPQLQT